jgi:hypothetical protein
MLLNIKLQTLLAFNKLNKTDQDKDLIKSFTGSPQRFFGKSFGKEMKKLGFSNEDLKEFYLFVKENNIPYYKRTVDYCEVFSYRDFRITTELFESKRRSLVHIQFYPGSDEKILDKKQCIFSDYFGSFDKKHSRNKLFDQIILEKDLVGLKNRLRFPKI